MYKTNINSPSSTFGKFQTFQKLAPRPDRLFLKPVRSAFLWLRDSSGKPTATEWRGLVADSPTLSFFSEGEAPNNHTFIEHNYTSLGTYKIVLTAVFSPGCLSRDSLSVNLKPPCCTHEYGTGLGNTYVNPNGGPNYEIGTHYDTPITTDVISGGAVFDGIYHVLDQSIQLTSGVYTFMPGTILYFDYGSDGGFSIADNAIIIAEGVKFFPVCPDSIWSGIAMLGNGVMVFQTDSSQGLRTTINQSYLNIVFGSTDGNGSSYQTYPSISLNLKSTDFINNYGPIVNNQCDGGGDCYNYLTEFKVRNSKFTAAIDGSFRFRDFNGQASEGPIPYAAISYTGEVDPSTVELTGNTFENMMNGVVLGTPGLIAKNNTFRNLYGTAIGLEYKGSATDTISGNTFIYPENAKFGSTPAAITYNGVPFGIKRNSVVRCNTFSSDSVVGKGIYMTSAALVEDMGSALLPAGNTWVGQVQPIWMDNTDPASAWKYYKASDEVVNLYGLGSLGPFTITTVGTTILKQNACK